MELKGGGGEDGEREGLIVVKDIVRNKCFICWFRKYDGDCEL